jgi:NifU-like protein involved in Fe-S cluster formation
MYTAEVMKRFRKPKNAGKLKEFNGLGKAGDPDCSDVIEMSILFDKGVIKNAKFLVYGCPGAISTTDAFIDLIKEKTIDQALNVSGEDISNLLGGLPLTHMHCSKLPVEAFKNALDNYQKNRGEK